MTDSTREGPGARGPYPGRKGARPLAERIAEREAPQPLCKCGCGQPTPWLTNKCRWRVYVPGHYRREAAYKDEAWLRAAYLDQRKSAEQIARECGVAGSSVFRYMDRFGIQRRDASEAHRGLMVGAKNPAWKGGIAKWDYASDWKVIARQMRDAAKWTCQKCALRLPRWGTRLHVHHIDENKFNNDLTNLIVLCWRCHARAHGRHGEVA